MAKKQFTQITAANFQVRPSSTLSNIAVVDSVVRDSTREHAEIPFPALSRNPHQPRSTFDAEKMQELADSIRENGLIEEIVVRRSEAREGTYEIVCGERRVIACRDLLNWTHIPATILSSCSDLEMRQIALIENAQREQLTPYELAQSYRALLDARDPFNNSIYSVRTLAAKLGKHKDHVQEHVKILEGSSDVIQLSREDPTVPVRVLGELSSVEDENDRLHLIEGVRSRQWKQDDIIAIVKQLKRQPIEQAAPEDSQPPADLPDPPSATSGPAQRDQTEFVPVPGTAVKDAPAPELPAKTTTVEEHERVVRPSPALALAERQRALAKHDTQIDKIVKAYREDFSSMSEQEKKAVQEHAQQWVSSITSLFS